MPADAQSRRPVVLVVEDDADTQAFMNAVLGRRYDVAAASTEAETRRELEARPESAIVVLMDLSLADGEAGAELTRRLRLDSRWATLPIIALTAHAAAADRDRALAAGCDEYLSKPIDRRKLFALIDSLLSR
jgi:CheY-like chemotaxis protein